MASIRDFVAPVTASGVRLDRHLAAVEDLGISRSQVQALIRDGRVTVNGETAKPSYLLSPGDLIRVEIPDPEPAWPEPEPIPLKIMFEDADLIVVDKPRGLVVHPAPGHRSGTLVNALLAHCGDLAGINRVLRPGIVHRLDKDTTGLLVAAKSDLGYRSLIRQLKEHKVSRQYLALVHGTPPAEKGKIDAPIGRHPRRRQEMAVLPDSGRSAVTYFRLVRAFREYSLLVVRLETGRTHQIRVHLAYIGHPVVADPVYGKRKNRLGLEGQALHAHLLRFTHPRSGEKLEFRANPPHDFCRTLEQLGFTHWKDLITFQNPADLP